MARAICCALKREAQWSWQRLLFCWQAFRRVIGCADECEKPTAALLADLLAKACCHGKILIIKTIPFKSISLSILPIDLFLKRLFPQSMICAFT